MRSDVQRSLGKGVESSLNLRARMIERRDSDVPLCDKSRREPRISSWHGIRSRWNANPRLNFNPNEKGGIIPTGSWCLASARAQDLRSSPPRRKSLCNVSISSHPRSVPNGHISCQDVNQHKHQAHGLTQYKCAGVSCSFRHPCQRDGYRIGLPGSALRFCPRVPRFDGTTAIEQGLFILR